MTTENSHQLFQQLFRSRGGTFPTVGPGLLDDEPIAPVVQRYRAHLRFFNEQCGILPVTCNRTHVDAINNPALNAVAGEAKGIGLIGVYYGCAVTLRCFFALLLSHRQVLPYLGDCRAEVKWSADLTLVDWMGSHRLTVSTLRRVLGRDDLCPRDPIRRAIAEQLWVFAMDFIFLHELAHLAAGHCRYFAEHHGLSEMAEDDQCDVKVSALRRASELEADAVAAQLGGYICYNRNVVGAATGHDEFDEVARLWAFAVGALFFLFAKPMPTQTSRFLGLHPHPTVRLLNVMSASVDAACDLHIPLVPEVVEEAWNLAIDLIQAARSAVRFGSDVDDTFAQDRRGVYSNLHELRQVADSIRQRCSGYAEVVSR